jgi:hypothetical protein
MVMSMAAVMTAMMSAMMTAMMSAMMTVTYESKLEIMRISTAKKTLKKKEYY